MIFIMGINMGRKDLDFSQSMLCLKCGQYGRYTVYMTYTVLTVFFIPIIKWNRRYYVVSSCCRTTWELDREIGRKIAKGEQVKIRPGDLTPTASGTGPGSSSCDGWEYAHSDLAHYETNKKKDPECEQQWYISRDKREDITKGIKVCSHCGFSTEEDYAYCPNCGNKL